MKTIRLLGTTLMSVLLCVIFAACSKEDDNFYVPSTGGAESGIPNNIIRYKTTDGIILRFENEDVFGGAKIISNKYSTTNGYGTLVFDSEVTAVESGSFYQQTTLSNITLPNSVVTIKSSAFSGCSKLKVLTIPSSVTSIEEDAFSGCSGLTSITIPSSVTSIGSFAFAHCSGLTSITIPSSVTSIDRYAFDGCRGLTSITIPSSVTSIDKCAFYGCSGLTSITIPNSVTSIGRSAFYDCSGLTSIYMKETSPTSVSYYDVFGNYKATLFVPIGTLGDYRNAYGWKRFENIQEWDAK